MVDDAAAAATAAAAAACDELCVGGGDVVDVGMADADDRFAREPPF